MRGSEFADLRAFATIARFSSFSAAARELAISPSALSQRMGELEAKLGVRLLNRTTRSVSLTENGAALLDKILPLFDGFDQALADLVATGHEAAGLLRLNVSRLAGMYLIAPILGDFHKAYPAITLDITFDDGLADIVAGRFDAGIRLGENLARDMNAIPIGGRRESMVVASPGFLEARRMPGHPEELREHPCIRFRWPGSGTIYRWEFEKAGKDVTIAVDGPLIANDTALMLAAAESGLGLAYVLDIEAVPFIEAGRLTRILADWTPPFSGFHLYHSSSRQMPRQLEAFIGFLRSRLEGDGALS